MCDEIVCMKEEGIAPESEKGQKLVMEWWSLVMEFTGGDMSLLPEMVKFNQSKQGWSEELKRKQSIADEFIGEALEIYFQKQGLVIPEMEGKK